MPTQAEWDAQEWYKYGFVALTAAGEVQQLEKSNYETIQNLLKESSISAAGGAGISMGSFSLSSLMTSALLTEFEKELQSKSGFIDCDPGFWMPMTLNSKVYCAAMQKMGVARPEDHYARMQKFKERFLSAHPENPFFQATDVGKNCFWWDYGSIKAYYDRLSTLVGEGPESIAMRKFFHLDQRQVEHLEGLQVDAHSLLIDCKIKRGIIRNSVLVGVRAESINVEGAVVIDSALSQFEGNQCLLYKVNENQPLALDPGSVRVDLQFTEKAQHLKLYTDLDRDGKKDWNITLNGNELSWAELEALVRA